MRGTTRPYGHINKFGKAEQIASARREIETMRARRFPAWRIEQAEADLAVLQEGR